MGRKVFISFLGTNNYLRTHYLINGEISAAVRFIQEALTDHFCNDWGENDRIIIFYTKASCAANWKNGGQTRIAENEEIEYHGLEEILRNKSYGKIVEDFEIPEGFSEKEIWDIFDIVYSKLKDCDEIYFDVTHAFRSIPLFSTVLFDFARFMLDSKLRQVCYGAFEKLGSYQDVKKIDIDQRVAPVIDLKSIIRLQNLTQVANGFYRYGKISDIGTMLEEDVVSDVFSAFKKEISNLEFYILTCKMEEIERGEFAEKIKNNVDELESSGLLSTAQTLLIKKLEDSISAFTLNGGINNIQAAIDWAKKYDMILQAYILAEESIISLLVKFYTKELDVIQKEKEKRQFISSLLGIPSDDKKKRKYRDLLKDYESLTDVLLFSDFIHRLRKPYNIIANNRNELAHGKKATKTKDEYCNELNFYFTCKEIIEERMANV